jgi:hypothetical protein
VTKQSAETIIKNEIAFSYFARRSSRSFRAERVFLVKFCVVVEVSPKENLGLRRRNLALVGVFWFVMEYSYSVPIHIENKVFFRDARLVFGLRVFERLYRPPPHDILQVNDLNRLR